jgi:hypothetical protein
VLAHGRWLSPAFSTTQTGRHDIAEILLKVVLNTKIKSNVKIINFKNFLDELMLITYLRVER